MRSAWDAVVVAPPDRHVGLGLDLLEVRRSSSGFTALAAPPPCRFFGITTSPSSRREADDRMINWVSVSLGIGLAFRCGSRIAATTASPRRPRRRWRSVVGEWHTPAELGVSLSSSGGR